MLNRIFLWLEELRTFREGAIYCAVEKAGLGPTAWVHVRYIRALLLGVGALL